MSTIIATDVGGTCTDTVIFSAGEPVRTGQVLSAPPDYGGGVMNSVEREAFPKPLRRHRSGARTRPLA